MTGAGRLVVVGTPIGNLGDLSARAAEALASAEIIACEDTRRTGRLLRHLGLSAPSLWVVNDHTEDARMGALLDAVEAGRSVVLVSDAGMPAVSDPGQRLVAAARQRGVAVEVVPGPTAGVTALVASGLAADRFVFEGFLPRKGEARQARLSEIAGERRTVVLYEAPHRLGATLADLETACGGERRATVARELTKLHEEVVTAPLGELVRRFGDGVRGEIVLVIEGAPLPEPAGDDRIIELLADARRRGLSNRDAVAEVVTATGAAKRRVYAIATGHAAAGEAAG